MRADILMNANNGSRHLRGDFVAPLGTAATQVLAEEVEACGFSFCGLYPEKHQDGDLLRLHHLNNVRIDTSKIVTVTDMGRDLLDYVVSGLKV